MIRLRIRGLKEFQRALARIEQGAPKVLSQALDTAARDAYREYQEQISGFTLRNAWTTRGARYELVPRSAIQKRGVLVSRVGHLAPYMRLQEHGGPIRTTAAPGLGARVGRSRTKVTSKARRLARIQNAARGKGATRAQQTASALAQARKGNRFALIPRKSGSGHVLVETRGKRTVRALWHVEQHMRVQPTHMLERTVERVKPKFKRNLEAAMARLLRG